MRTAERTALWTVTIWQLVALAMACYAITEGLMNGNALHAGVGCVCVLFMALVTMVEAHVLNRRLEHAHAEIRRYQDRDETVARALAKTAEAHVNQSVGFNADLLERAQNDLQWLHAERDADRISYSVQPCPGCPVCTSTIAELEATAKRLRGGSVRMDLQS